MSCCAPTWSTPGHVVLSTGSGAEAITMARERPDLIVLDLRLPDVPGEEVARELRSFSAVPIVMLTARSRRGGPDPRAGARRGRLCDQAVQPAGARAAGAGDLAPRRRRAGPSRALVVRSGEVVVDETARQATVRGASVELTPTEWGILAALATVPGRVYSRYELINRVRGYEFDGYERTIDSHVKNLRRKIERDRTTPDHRDGAGRRLPARPHRVTRDP